MKNCIGTAAAIFFSAALASPAFAQTTQQQTGAAANGQPSASQSSGRQPTTVGRLDLAAIFRDQPCVPRKPNARARFYLWGGDGILENMNCQVLAIQQGVSARTLNDIQLNLRLSELRRMYNERALRQQRWMDTASLGVFTGVLGFQTSVHAGTTTQTAWGYATLLPVVVAQFNANEPTRDLFHGAGIGLDIISARYALFRSSARSLHDFVSDTETHADLEAARTQCDAFDQTVGAVNAWDVESAERSLIAGEVGRIAAICSQLRATYSGLRAVESAYRPWEEQLPYLLANDVLALHSTAVQRDYDLRYTPVETLAGIASLPLQAASTLLTGQNARTAIDGLRTQATFASLDMRLSDLVIPTFDTPAIDYVTIAPSVLARRGRPGAEPSRSQVDGAIANLAETAADLNRARERLAYAATLYQTMRRVAEANSLTFSYDATTRSIRIVLDKPATRQAPLFQIGANAGATGPVPPPVRPEAATQGAP